MILNPNMFYIIRWSACAMGKQGPPLANAILHSCDGGTDTPAVFCLFLNDLMKFISYNINLMASMPTKLLYQIQ